MLHVASLSHCTDCVCEFNQGYTGSCQRFEFPRLPLLQRRTSPLFLQAQHKEKDDEMLEPSQESEANSPASHGPDMGCEAVRGCLQFTYLQPCTTTHAGCTNVTAAPILLLQPFACKLARLVCARRARKVCLQTLARPKWPGKPDPGTRPRRQGLRAVRA